MNTSGAHWIVALVAVSVAACARPAPPEPVPPPPVAAAKPDAAMASPDAAPALKTVDIQDLGLRLDLPVTWTVSAQADGHHLLAPEGDPAAQAVWLLQAQTPGPAKGAVDSALALKGQLLDELKTIDPQGKLLRTVAFSRDGVDGIRMETMFEREGRRWRKDQLLVRRGERVLSLGVTATEDQFDAIGPTWEGLLASVRFSAQPATP
ncbi:MAG: hypothetical protein ABIJ09_19740 [Pseudomonadota bacterium]